MNIYNLFKNLIKKVEQSTVVEAITNHEIDSLFGTAAGTGTDAQDYVVEHYQEGVTQGYTKWASGKCEVWKRITKTLNATIQWNSLYYGVYTDNSITYTMPGFTGFVGYPMVQLSLQCTNGNLIGIIGDYSSYTTTGIGNYYVYSAGNTTNMTATINVYAVGRWK